MKIKVNKIIPPTMEHFDPDGKSLGLLNYYEHLDLRIQVQTKKVAGYRVLGKDDVFYLRPDGRILNWDGGSYELITKLLDKLIMDT